MKITHLIFAFFLIFTISVSAQEQKKSKSELQQRQLFFSDSTNLVNFDYAKLSPLFVKDLMPKQISRIAIAYQRDQGKFIEAQGSTKTNTAHLYSDGVTELKGVKLYGSFDYKKVFEDSTRFAHQTRNNITTPYYYGSPTNNHYERAIYNFKALGAKSIFADKLTFGLGLDYTVADHFANNDPRGSINEYQLNAKASLAYNLSDKISLGAGYIFGYGQEKVTVGYKNPIYYESLSSPRHVNYLINGYGEPIPKPSYRNYNDFQDRSGFEGVFSAKNTKFGSFYIHGSLVEEKQRYDYRTSDEITDMASYDLIKTTINLLWDKTLLKGRIATNISYKNLAGEDYNVVYFAKNYVYSANELEANVNYSTTRNKTIYNYLVGLRNFNEERIDGITGNKVYFNNLVLNAGFGLQHQINNNQSIGASLGAGYTLPLDDSFFVSPANESYFTRDVIFHNYLYNTASSYSGSFSANYSFPFYNTMQAAVKINLVYATKAELQDLQRTLTTTPGKDRFFSNISLNLYF